MKRFLVLVSALSILGCGGGGNNGAGTGGNNPAGLRVSVSKSRLDFASFMGQGFPSETLNTSIAGGTGTYYSGISTTMPGIFYATFTPTSNTTASITISQDTDFVPAPRLSSGVITLALYSDQNGNNKVWSKDIPTTLSIFDVDSSSIDLKAYEGQATGVSGALKLNPADSGNIVTASVTGASWLSASRTAPDTISVTANPAGLTPGSYQGTIQLAALRSTLQIPAPILIGTNVTLPAPQTIVLNAKTSASSLQGTIPLSFKDGNPDWTASSDKDWLVLDGTSGSGAAALSYSIDLSKTANIPNWSTTTATVKIKATGLTPATTQVLLQKSLPEVQMVLPAILQSNHSSQCTVVGKGFSQLASGSDFVVQGASDVTGTIASDNRAILQLGALSAGQYTVSVPTATGLISTSAPLTVADPAGFSYEAVPHSGNVTYYAYDPTRRAVFAVNPDQNTLERIQWSGTHWDTTSLVVDSIGSIGLSLDYQRIYVVSGETTLLEIDPGTLQILATHVAQDGVLGFMSSLYYTSNLLTMTQDGRIWFGGNQWTTPTYFDTEQGLFTNGSIGLSSYNSQLYSPRFFASRDGANQLIVNGSMSPPMLNYLYLADSSSITSQTNVPLVYYGADFNLEGSRVLIDGGDLYDTSSFSLLGQAKVEATEAAYLYPYAGLLSSDGSRAYRPVFDDAMTRISSVDVFDVSQYVAGTTYFLKIGSIAVPDASKATLGFPYGFFMSDMDQTLFLLGDLNLVVVPIPAEPSAQEALQLLAVKGALRQKLR